MNDQFDRHIRSRIYPLETEVPDFLWEAVDRQLHPRKHRRRWFFLFSLMVLGGFFILISQSSPEPAASLYGKNEQDSYPSNESNTSIPSFGEQKGSPLSGSKTSIEIRKIIQAEGSKVSTIEPSATVLAPINQRDTKLVDQGGRNSAGEELTGQSETVDQSVTPLIDHKLGGEPAELPGLNSLSFYPVMNLSDPKIEVCPSFSSELEIRPFFELTIGGGIPGQLLTLKDPESFDYLNLRQRTEKERSSFAIQAYVGAEIDNRFEIKIGLGSSRIYEVFDYIDETATRTITNIITDTIIVNGTPVIRTDTSIVTQYGQRIKLSQNRYATLDLPLVATYKFKVSDHQFLIQAGAILNLALWTRGDILLSNSQIMSIDNKAGARSAIFKPRTGFEIMAAVGYELEMSERNRLRILCSLRQNMSDMTTSIYPLSQRYKHFHLGVSWKHQF